MTTYIIPDMFHTHNTLKGFIETCKSALYAFCCIQTTKTYFPRFHATVSNKWWFQTISPSRPATRGATGQLRPRHFQDMFSSRYNKLQSFCPPQKYQLVSTFSLHFNFF